MWLKVYSITLIIICLTLSGSACSSDTDGQLKNTNIQLQQKVQLELDALDRDVSAASSGLAATGLSGDEARKILEGVCSNRSYLVTASTTDTAGKMVTIAPDAYRSYEGTDISKQDAVIKFERDKKPLLSQVFRAVEGFDGVVLMWPIISDKTGYIGSVSVLFKPEALVSSVAGSAIKNSGLEVMALQPDGLIVYGSEGTETGKNLFKDPMYKDYTELLLLGSRFTSDASGSGNYTFPAHESGQLVKKLAVWCSAGLHGTDWRLVSIKSPD